MLRAEKINIGLLAHVDAGKTTLAERLLLEGGQLRKAGRVDHGDAFLDTDETERRRGITIFSKMAQAGPLTFVDTPGHTDFSAEMERTLQILDYAVLIISAPDGVQGHVPTLWSLLSRYEVPTFVFLNKMDQPGADAGKVMKELRDLFGEGCVLLREGTETGTAGGPAEDSGSGDTAGGAKGAGTAGTFRGDSGSGDTAGGAKGAGTAGTSRGDSGSGKAAGGAPETGTADTETGAQALENVLPQDDIAVLDDDLMERYLEGERVTLEDARDLIIRRKLIPCWAGSALRGDGVALFLDDMKKLLVHPLYPEDFGARVYKITRDDSGKRLTWLKVTGGTLRAKQVLGEEKAEQLMLWSGAGCTQVQEAGPGVICAVAGLKNTAAGEGLGAEKERALPVLESVLSYEIGLPEGADVHESYLKLRTLEEELPELHITWNAQTKKIYVRVMGMVQIEILTELIKKRFGLDVSFDVGSIVYKETIEGWAEGVGHYEPLRHYAEVHLLLEEGSRGSGLTFSSACSTDDLELNWQRLIMTHLEERQHAGVLTGAPVTDMHITLLAGRAHEKHTEGGDFRQAVYRAVRQGLRKAASVLLEPLYAYRLEVPERCTGRAMSDLTRMHASFTQEAPVGNFSVFTGEAPVALMRDYQTQVLSYTGGEGRLTCRPAGYASCHNAEEVIAAAGYDPDADTENPSGSVFCSHGAGFFVPWDQVEDYMHLEGYDGHLSGREETGPGADGADGFGGEGTGSSAGGASDGIRGGRMSGGSSAGFRGEGVPAGSSDGFRGGRTGAGFHSGFRGGRTPMGSSDGRSGRSRASAVPVNDDELMEIFNRTYGSGKGERTGWQKHRRQWETAGRKTGASAARPVHRYLLVDGYNIIYAWKELAELAKDNLDGARMALADILANYQGYHAMDLILVFDAYKVEGGEEHVIRHGNISIVFTREAETADAYIERTVNSVPKNCEIQVATSDAAEQLIIWGEGARRISARELREDIDRTNGEILREYLGKLGSKGKNYLLEHAPDELKEELERIRLGKTQLDMKEG